LSVKAPTQPIRLNRYLALCGVASRRRALQLVFDGVVEVNGEIVREPSHPVRPGLDRVSVSGREVAPPPEWLVLAFHKPRGYLTTRADIRGRPTVMDLLGELGHRVFPVGRLDKESEGLLLLTNHGDLAYALLHPRHGVEKEYVVTLRRKASDRVVKRLARGVPIGGGDWARPVLVERAGNDWRTLRIVLTEGKKREVRRMIRSVGHEVERLVRTAVAGVRLGDLPPGKVRPLTREERARLEEATGVDLSPPPWAVPSGEAS
jgi:pseudouridine synthase